MPPDSALIACVDVAYHATGATAACVLFRDWGDASPERELVVPIEQVEPYEPGQFYRRELPCLRAVLATVDEPLRAIVVDGYVWLGVAREPGLGAHLFAALGERVPVIGVAKTRYRGADSAHEIRRGESQAPLFVTAAGLDPAEAARRIAEMHGPYRIPTMLRKVDQLCRGHTE
jgi:deoxyribonuclease V